MKRRVRDISKFQINLNIFKLLSILLIIIFICFTPLVIQSAVKISKIECSSQLGQCDDQIINSLELIVNNNLRQGKTKAKEILDQDLQVSSYLIQYQIPSTLKIDIVIKKPKFAIANSNNQIFLIDKDFKVLNITDKTELNVLKNSNSDYKIGDIISEKDKFALILLEKINFLYSINESIIENDYIKVKIKNYPQTLFSAEGDVDFLVGSIRLIFSRLNDEAEGIRMNEIREIDLRYKNPVLRKI